RVGTVKLLGRFEAAAIGLQRRNEQFGCEMGGEGVGKPEFGRQHRAKIARSQNPQWHFRSRGRYSPDALIWTGWSQEGLHLKHILREVFGGFRRAAQGAQRELVGPGRAAQPKVNTAWKQLRQRPELLGDNVGRMVGE